MNIKKMHKYKDWLGKEGFAVCHKDSGVCLKNEEIVIMIKEIIKNNKIEIAISNRTFTAYIGDSIFSYLCGMFVFQVNGFIRKSA